MVGLPLAIRLLSTSCLEWSLQPVVKGGAGVRGLPYPCLDKLFFLGAISLMLAEALPHTCFGLRKSGWTQGLSPSPSEGAGGAVGKWRYGRAGKKGSRF